MKYISRALLRLFTLAVPVVLAACYGPPSEWRASKRGKVIDRDTHEGIAGIELSCLREDGSVENSDYSNFDGSFTLGYDTSCATIEAKDVDGTQNGSYTKTSMPFSETSQIITIQMVKE